MLFGYYDDNGRLPRDPYHRGGIRAKETARRMVLRVVIGGLGGGSVAEAARNVSFYNRERACDECTYGNATERYLGDHSIALIYFASGMALYRLRHPPTHPITRNLVDFSAVSRSSRLSSSVTIIFYRPQSQSHVHSPGC